MTESTTELRRAAAMMRKRAGDATPSPWLAVADTDTSEMSVIGGPRDHYLADVHEWSTGLGNPSHIASWHPAVALAVAEWLESTANDVEHVHTPIYNLTSTTVARAVAVARAYLGEGDR